MKTKDCSGSSSGMISMLLDGLTLSVALASNSDSSCFGLGEGMSLGVELGIASTFIGKEDGELSRKGVDARGEVVFFARNCLDLGWRGHACWFSSFWWIDEPGYKLCASSKNIFGPSQLLDKRASELNKGSEKVILGGHDVFLGVEDVKNGLHGGHVRLRRQFDHSGPRTGE